MAIVGRYANFILPANPAGPATTTTSPIEYQLFPFFCRIDGGIAAGANQDVFKWTEGTLLSFHTFSVRDPQGGECIPLGLLAQNTHTLINNNNGTINVSIPAAGIAWPAGVSFNGWVIIQY